MPSDNEIVGQNCLLSTELVILVLHRNYIWERVSSLWGKCLTERRERETGKGQVH